MCYNYKGTFSIVLLAVCDGNYRFTMVDIGEVGKESDGGVFSNSAFGQSLDSNSIDFPQPISLPDRPDMIAPYVFVGDEGLPLRKDLMRPFPAANLTEKQAIFNYRLSRARRIIENTFGILAARFRIFRRPILATPDHVISYVKACIVVHNYLRVKESSVYCPSGFVDGEDGEGNVISGQWRRETEQDTGMQRPGQMGGNRSSWTAASVRDIFCDYFSTSDGEVAWQYQHVRRTSYN